MTRRTDILEGYAKFRSILNQTQVDMDRINALSDALEKVNGKLAIHEASGTFITFPISDRTRSVLVRELQNDLDYTNVNYILESVRLNKSQKYIGRN